MSTETRMKALEASFLSIERPGLPMHVAGVVMIEPGKPVTMDELRRMVASRIRRLPKFRQRARFSLLGMSRPQWVHVPRVSLRRHIYHHRLREPGRPAQLTELCGRIHETLLPRDRPLWEMHLIDGLEGGGQALVIKTHHAITDGLAGIEIAEVLFDRAPMASRRLELPSTRFAGAREPSPFTALQSLLGLAFTAAGGPIALPGPFNGPVGAHRKFAMASIRMDAVLRAKRRLGGSVDDVMVAVVAAGLRRYLREVRYPGVPHALRAMLPVSTRPSSKKAHLGNHVTTVFVDLPMDTDQLPELVRSIATSKSTLRTTHAAGGMGMLIEAAGLLPNQLHGAVVRVVAALPYANLVLSDIPGPDEVLYLLGRRILACYPMIPLPPGIGLSIATVSMGGMMGVGVTADPGLIPNPQRLATAIEHVVAAFDHSSAAPRKPRTIAQTRHAA
jgi:diacylglycerol O-acyltransferase / wax synthase